MIPELGHFSLILGLGLCLLQGIFSFWRPADRLARPLVIGQVFWLSIAILTLWYAFLENDFSVIYVARHSNSTLPWAYQIAALWSASEGSMLLWVWIFSLWTWVLAAKSRVLPLSLSARILGNAAGLQTGFLIFLLQTSNPFLRQWMNVPIDGQDLNPLLQDIGLILHPPLLYIGYIGFGIGFAFALALLWREKSDWQYLSWIKNPLRVAWGFLSIGIVLGSWWAYDELGWGGWWFWDPVENISLMPWLVGIALLHSYRLVGKKTFYGGWFFLSLLAFILSLMGAFLVRSGVVMSMHAFAIDGQRGLYLLAILVVVFGVTIFQFIRRYRDFSEKPLGLKKLWSEETFLLVQILLLTLATLTVFLGTLYPLFYEAFTHQKISVGFPYFNRVFIPLVGPIFLLLILYPFLFKVNVRAWVALALLCPLSLIFLPSPTQPAAWGKLLFGVALGELLILSVCLRPGGWGTSRMSMSLAHFGVGLCILGITLNTQYARQIEVKIKPGDIVNLGGHRLQFQALHQKEGPNYVSHQAEFLLDGRNKLYPEKRFYIAQPMPITETDIDVTLWRDIYIALGEPLETPFWSARLYYHPFVRWIWVGGLLMGLAALLAAFRSAFLKNR